MIKTLHEIQKKLKAPKGQNNSFGGYKYRSCEDILEAVKKVLPDEVSLILTDDIIFIGDRYYVKATASLVSGKQENAVSVSAFARESLDKKGMDSAQITGAASSYARKYALNGLFCIDDTKDADATNDGKEEPKDNREDKAFMRDFLYALGNTDDVPSLIEEMGDHFGSLSDEMNEQITGQLEIRRSQIKNNVQTIKPKFTFLDVHEAVEFAKEANEIINDQKKSYKEISTWMLENDHKAKALDVSLKAGKYQTPEGTPYQRLVNAYNKRQPLAAE